MIVMDEYDFSTYGERIAETYDELHSSYEAAAVSTLAELAGSGPALELGIGTGRVALPLAARAVKVHGIDSSAAMVAKLRAKPGGDQIPVTIGDFADVSVEGEFSLVFIAFNTFFLLLTQGEQIRCFRNAAAHLGSDGIFLIEAFVPDLTRFNRGQEVSVSKVTGELVKLDVSMHDAASQRVDSNHVLISEKGTRLYPIKIRYAWPSEIDLMAELAGLRLKWRWGGWERERFTATSEKHISVYERKSTSGG